MSTPVPVDPEPGTVSTFIHQLVIRDNDSQRQYPWTLEVPFPLALTDEQAGQMMQTIASSLPPNPYGWQLTGSLNSTTTTVTVDEHDYTTVDVPAVPGAPDPPQPPSN